jgi:DNA processing protein
VSFERLVGRFGSAIGVLAVARRRDGVRRMIGATASEDGPPTLDREAALLAVDAARAPDRWLEPIRRAEVDVLTLLDDAYPTRLRRIGLPPPVLFVRGDVTALERPRAVAIVGTRRPTEVGRATSGRIGDAVAALGATVVSGLALGVDGAAHAAAVRAGTPTLAVIGGGHDRLYPASHAALARAIVAGGGAVVSEFAPWTSPTRGTFPRRNRIISGLADATVVVEAGARSGALTTAAWALEQGRGLHIVPGRLDDPSVAGSLAFLRENGDAKVVSGIPELLEDLGLLDDDLGPGARIPLIAALTGVERALAAQLAAGVGGLDELVAATGQGSATVLAALTSLEMRGLVLEAFGRYRATGALAGSGPRRRRQRSPGPAVTRRPAA